MFILIVFIIFTLLLLLPFIPGIFELIKKEDSEPLFISMDYTRNPRYFGKSFKMLLGRATSGLDLSPGFKDIKLSKNETMEIAQSLDIPLEKEINHLLYVIGDLCSESHVRFDKEVYVTGNATIGPNNTFQALYSEGDVKVSEGTQFQRWLDADGNISVGVNCDLGISISSGNKIYLSNGCVFRRLYGMPVLTGYNQVADFQYPAEKLLSKESPLPDESFIRKDDNTVPTGTIINNNIVFTGDVRVGSRTIISGTIKSYGNIYLENDVIIYGNIFADGDIFIGRNAGIGGHLFSQGSIFISEHTLISRPDKIKSIIAKKEIKIEQNVNIYGFVATEGHGSIL
jgi:predicted acyltransferase (DUF342 family)